MGMVMDDVITDLIELRNKNAIYKPTLRLSAQRGLYYRWPKGKEFLMVSEQIETPVDKVFTAEVYDKTSSLLRVFQNHIDNGCEHCKSILKNGLGPSTTPEPEPIPEPPRNDLQ